MFYINSMYTLPILTGGDVELAELETAHVPKSNRTILFRERALGQNGFIF